MSERGSAARVEGFVIPVTVDDLAANGLLGEADPQVCWERSVETLTARKDDIAGLAVASDERIEAYLLYVDRGVEETEILSLRSFVEDGGARLTQLLSQLRARGIVTFRFPKVHPAEISKEFLETLGFRPAGGHLLYAARARSDVGYENSRLVLLASKSATPTRTVDFDLPRFFRRRRSPAPMACLPAYGRTSLCVFCVRADRRTRSSLARPRWQALDSVVPPWMTRTRRPS